MTSVCKVLPRSVLALGDEARQMRLLAQLGELSPEGVFDPWPQRDLQPLICVVDSIEPKAMRRMAPDSDTRLRFGVSSPVPVSRSYSAFLADVNALISVAAAELMAEPDRASFVRKWGQPAFRLELGFPQMREYLASLMLSEGHLMAPSIFAHSQTATRCFARAVLAVAVASNGDSPAGGGEAGDLLFVAGTECTRAALAIRDALPNDVLQRYGVGATSERAL